MAKQVIDISTPNDGLGTPLRDGGDIINDNFTELYTGAETVAATDKPIPVDADVMPIQDSAAANVKKKVTWANIKATLKTYFDTLYGTLAAVDLNTAKVTNAAHTGQVTGSTVLTIANGVINPAKLDDEFKTIVDLAGGVNLDWSVGQTFTKALTAAPTYTFSNLHIGVKFIESTGDFSPIFPAGFTYVGGTRAATGITLYQIVCTNATTPVGYYTILKNEA